MKQNFYLLALGVAGALSMLPNQAQASGTWTPLTHQPPFNACEPELLTDGRVLVQAYAGDPSCYTLTPDVNGNYINGTWTQVASMITPRLYYASSVLADGRVIVCGGEYSGTNVSSTWTNQCEIYNPVTNSWTSLNPPTGWNNIGDAPCVVLPNGKFLLGSDFDNRSALFDPTTNSWTAGGTFAPPNGNVDEDCWGLLPNNRVMDVEANGVGSANGSEYYNPATNSWTDIGPLPVLLTDPSSRELGASMLLPNGNLFQMGAMVNLDANGSILPTSCIYSPTSNTWALGPAAITSGGVALVGADAPAAMEPNGLILLALGKFSAGGFSSPTFMAETDGVTMTQISAPGNAGGNPYNSRMLVLPSGQIMFTSSSSQIYIYTPSGTYQQAWQPTISSVSGTLQLGSTNNVLTGTQLNGISQGSSYGDDSTNFTNYPIVRVQNIATGHVFYCRTHDHSTMGVATGSAAVSTKFDVPTGVETGPSNLYVVANGIPSAPQAVNIVGRNVVLPNGYSLFRGFTSSGSLSSLFFGDASYLDMLTGPTLTPKEAPIQLVITAASPTLTPTGLSFTVTGHTNTLGITQSIALFNFSTGTYDLLDTRTTGTGDATVTVNATGTLSNYVSASGQLKAKVSFIATGPTTVSRWQALVDVANWGIH